MCLSISLTGSRRMLKGIQEAARLLILTSRFQKKEGILGKLVVVGVESGSV